MYPFQPSLGPKLLSHEPPQLLSLLFVHVLLAQLSKRGFCFMNFQGPWSYVNAQQPSICTLDNCRSYPTIEQPQSLRGVPRSRSKSPREYCPQEGAQNTRPSSFASKPSETHPCPAFLVSMHRTSQVATTGYRHGSKHPHANFSLLSSFCKCPGTSKHRTPAEIYRTV